MMYRAVSYNVIHYSHVHVHQVRVDKRIREFVLLHQVILLNHILQVMLLWFRLRCVFIAGFLSSDVEVDYNK